MYCNCLSDNIAVHTVTVFCSAVVEINALKSESCLVTSDLQRGLLLSINIRLIIYNL